MNQTNKHTLHQNKIAVRDKKVLVGVSGGVDSSVAVILLKEQGYDVEGVFAKVWQPDFVECIWRDEMKDAMRVCAKLEIPFHFLDLEKEYKEFVADYMINEYQKGRTPNPDVMCNTYIKFGFIYDYAIKNGFDFVATGHYAQNKEGILHRGFDIHKDQSYFLWNISPEKFKNILFPIGHLAKDKVRDIAQKYGLFTADKKDSQGLCFIGPIDMKSFLKKLIKTKPGDVYTIEGTKVGIHEGVEIYTTGERHGFTIFPEFKKVDQKPLFVIDKDVKSNKLIVGTECPNVKSVILSQVQFYVPTQKQEIDVQFRYRQKPMRGFLVREKDSYKIEFDQAVDTFVAQGQSAVFYDQDMCLGGGIIQKVIY